MHPKSFVSNFWGALQKVFVPEELLEPLLQEYYSMFYPDFP